MSVKLIDNEAFYGYRVRRAVDGKLFQEYFSLKVNGKRATGKNRTAIQNQAEARDAALKNKQIETKAANKSDRCFHSDGSVRGISFLQKLERSGNRTPIFQVGIASEVESRTICTSFSLFAHGNEAAWEKAVELYCKHKNIKKGSKLYKQLMAAMPNVKVSKPAKPAKKAAAKKPAAKKAVAKKAPAKKAAAKKPAAKKAVVKKAPAKKAAAKKAPAKKAVAKKAPAKKAAAKKPAAKKAVAKKAPAKKVAAKKPAAKKAVAKKAPAKKAAAKKPAAKKAVAKKAPAKKVAKKKK